MSTNRKLFLSGVSSEFASHRKLLTDDLKRPTLDVAVQEYFIVTGGSTLEKLDDYIRTCDGMIHLIGRTAGAIPEEPAVAALLKRYPNLATKLAPLEPHLNKPQPGFSYTQWEAYLALYHERPIFVYRPTGFNLDAVSGSAEMQAQNDHFERICSLGHDRGTFANEERLSSAVLCDLVEILPRLESTIDVLATRLRHTKAPTISAPRQLTRSLPPH